MSNPRSPRHRRLFLLLFFLVIPFQLQGCKIITFLGGTLVTYTLEKILDKGVDKFFGTAAAPKPSDGAVSIDKSTGRFTIPVQVFHDKKTGTPITILKLTGIIKNGKYQYDDYSLAVIKDALGDSLCESKTDKNGKPSCKVTNVSQK